MSDVKPPIRIPASIVALGILLMLGAVWIAVQKFNQPKDLEIAADTTVILTPLDADGRMDYETPLNETMR